LQWALSFYYGMYPRAYLNLLHTRWQELGGKGKELD